MASPLPASPKVRFGAFELDATAGKLLKSGIPIKLQPQPLRVLLLLTERPGQVVTREEIQRCLWGDSTFVDFAIISLDYFDQPRPAYYFGK
jgi:DNA-binding winged helix-turn-helix (wHTH) protein